MSKQKQLVQDRVVEVSKTKNFLLLSMATGCGKTLAALRVAQNAGGKWLILCKETNHIEEWEKEIKKHKIDLDCKIICYQSLHKVKGTYNIICDECHALTLKKKNQIINNINYKRITFLTATLPKNKLGHLTELSDNSLKELKLDLDGAIKMGILPEPKIFIYKLLMTDAQEEKYDKIIDSIEKLKKELESPLNLDPGKTEIKLLYVAKRRKDIVANFKIKHVRRLLKKLDKEQVRYICFTNSIQQLDSLCKSNSFIHSKKEGGKKMNAKIIKDFNDKKVNHIFTVKMLTESANLEDIQEGVLIQLDKEELTALQRIGRVLRAYVPVVHIFIMKDTMDEFYLRNSLQKIDKKYVKIFEEKPKVS